ncbi:MAG: hypothetical protein FJ109_18095, partial [Deltaproteobacteria bacterium]|nr:hypothetical protein [Deltaproteobacteria bacterium]
MKRLRTFQTVPAALVALTLVAAGGCSKDAPENRIPPQSVQPAEQPAAKEEGKPAGGEEVIKPIEPVPVIPIRPEEEDRIGLLAEEVLDFLEGKFSKDTIFFSRYKEGFERNIRDSKQFISVLRDIYTTRKYAPLFFTYEDKRPTLTDEGKKLKDLLLGISSHGLPEKEYRLEDLEAGLGELDRLADEYNQVRTGLSTPKAATLWSLLEGYSNAPDESSLKKLLLDNGFTNADTALVRELVRFYPNLLQAKKRLNEAVQVVDILLLRGFFRFLLDFQYVYRAHPFQTTRDASLAHVTFRERLKEDFDKAEPRFAQYLAEVIPDNPIYRQLGEGLRHYRQIRDEGAIDKLVVKKSLKKGSSGPHVQVLAERLAAEGYLKPQHVSSKFGAELHGAVREYQKTHQLRVNGETDTNTRSSLNIPMATRVKQIELSLQRWRESDIVRQKPAYYFRVNIPQFEVEVWENGQIVRVHRIVVGNANEEVSIERKQRGRFNQTPLLSKSLTTVVLNPLWFPPPRLQKELLGELEKEPDFFEKNNYGIKMKDDGSELIFQKPGPDNALGLVKYLFPNEFDVYP